MFHHLSILAIVAFAGINSGYGNHLIGEHVCAKDEKYTVTFEKHIKKNVTRREYVWCMSVPPRCSKYITEEVDTVKVFEEERTRKIDKCCEGYIEDKTQTYCIPKCKSCMNGICTAPETCSCLAGFAGIFCNQTCETGFWGQSCALQCDCAQRGPCTPETGYCICEPGTTGLKCEISISSASDRNVENCTETNKTIPETVKNETKEPDVIGGMNFTVPPTQEPTTKTSSTTAYPLVVKKEQHHTSDYNTSIATPTFLDTTENSKKNFNSIGKTHQFSDKKPEQLLMHQITIENSDSNVTNTLIVFIISIAVGIAIILILVATMSIMISRYKKQRDLAIKNVLSIKSTIDNNKNRLSSETIIQRSVFHTPLPDPPVFQNPVFTLQDSQNIHKGQYSNFSEFSTPEIQSLYDFPPSSGSYRAASLPDPGLETTSEPVYDEIPASRRPRPVSSIGNCRHSCCGNAHCQWNNT